MKKVLALLLTVILIAGLTAVAAAAEETTNNGKLSEDLIEKISKTDDPNATIDVIIHGGYDDIKQALSLDKKTTLALLDTPGEHGFETKYQEMTVDYFRTKNLELFDEIKAISPEAVFVKEGACSFVSNQTKAFYSWEFTALFHVALPAGDIVRIAELDDILSISLFVEKTPGNKTDDLTLGKIVYELADEPDEYGLYEVLVFKCVPLYGRPAFVLVGDVDRDGELTIVDATGVQRRLAGLGSADFIDDSADFDNDGDVTILDATGIQRRLAGLA